MNAGSLGDRVSAKHHEESYEMKRVYSCKSSHTKFKQFVPVKAFCKHAVVNVAENKATQNEEHVDAEKSKF